MYVYGSSPSFNYPVDVVPMAPAAMDMANAPSVCTAPNVANPAQDANKVGEPVDLQATLNAIQSTLSAELQPHVVHPLTTLPQGQPFCPAGVIPSAEYAKK
ncbi:hypothetical protein STCU_12340 [Strigomonas culicis]|uniref:Uncharacterized protein n=1 Tax=Strigomonas culicis TaxID=28005 RepID=S9UX78_9TRYP|nr:hypothetical protein STCU_12340 [Strigomonas culicis]|eukprot:EPY15110.1 hypothetical protein STCU_12340 [Strigomonas culicis]